jgi:hypothetical protein
MDVDRKKFDEWFKQQQGQKPENMEVAWQAFRAGHALALQEEQQTPSAAGQPASTLGVPPRR